MNDSATEMTDDSLAKVFQQLEALTSDASFCHQHAGPAASAIKTAADTAWPLDVRAKQIAEVAMQAKEAADMVIKTADAVRLAAATTEQDQKAVALRAAADFAASAKFAIKRAEIKVDRELVSRLNFLEREAREASHKVRQLFSDIYTIERSFCSVDIAGELSKLAAASLAEVDAAEQEDQADG